MAVCSLVAAMVINDVTASSTRRLVGQQSLKISNQRPQTAVVRPSDRLTGDQRDAVSGSRLGRGVAPTCCDLQLSDWSQATRDSTLGVFCRPSSQHQHLTCLFQLCLTDTFQTDREIPCCHLCSGGTRWSTAPRNTHWNTAGRCFCLSSLPTAASLEEMSSAAPLHQTFKLVFDLPPGCCH